MMISTKPSIKERTGEYGYFILRVYLLPVLLLFWCISASAQAPTISYPSVAQGLTRGYSQSNLTVKLVFNGVCAGTNTVRIAFPASVTYVAGSVTKTTGSPGLSIAEGSIANLSRPELSISGIAAVGDSITFTVARRADCGSLATAKDSVYFIAGSGCSNASEVAGTVNTYNIFSPALSITPAAALTDVLVGTTATRTTTVTNGGNGDLDTLRFYVVYPGGGIVNTNTNYRITANSVNFDTLRKSGDTLFYRIYGPTIFGGNNLLTSGEVVTIQEPVRVLKCNSTTSYGAGWGRSMTTVCQWTTGTSTVTMAVGVPNLSPVRHEIIQHTNMCQPSITRYTYKNVGSESVTGAGMAYNVNPLVGINASGASLGGNNIGSYSDFRINGVSIPFCTSCDGAGASVTINLTTDPDGPLGLRDADGDGFYDDLAVGDSLVLDMYVQFNCESTCPSDHSTGAAKLSADFDNQCGVAQSRSVFYAFPSGSNSPIGSFSVTGPSDINNGDVFTVSGCFARRETINGTYYNCSTDSLFYRVKMPAGVSYVPGTATFDGASAPAYVSNDTLYVRGRVASGVNFTSGVCYAADFTLNCGSYSAAAFDISIKYVCEASCSCQELWGCQTYTPVVHCPGPCADGGLTTKHTNIQRTTTGFTDSTGTIRVALSSLPAASKKRVLPCDTVLITAKGVQMDGTSGGAGHTWANGFLSIEYDQMSGSNVLDYAGGTVDFYDASAGTHTPCALPAPSITAGSGVHNAVFDLSSCIASTTLSPGDSMNVFLKAVILNNPGLTTTMQPLSGFKIKHYNLISGTEYTCDAYSAELYAHRYIVGTRSGLGGQNISGCSNYFGLLNLWSMNTVSDLYPGEYRPAMDVDSIVVFYNGTNGTFDTSYAAIYRTRNQDGSLSTVLLGTPITTATGFKWINPGTWLISDEVSESGANRVDFRLLPSCNSVDGNYSVHMYGKSNRYAYTAACMSNYSLSTTSPLSFMLPSTTVQNNTGTVQGTQSNHSWDIQINNPSTQTARYTWMALEKGSGTGGIIVDSVKLLPAMTTLTPVGTYNGTDKWYHIDTSFASGSSQQARVFFHYSSCSMDSIRLKSGWNCSGYPSPDPSAYHCSGASTYLKLDPQASQVQLTVQRQPGGGSSIPLCTTDSAVILVNSAQAANLGQPYVTFYPPTGLTLLTPVWVEYPRGSGNYQSVAVSSLGGGGYMIDLNTHTGISANGMLGTAGASPSYSPLGGDREARVGIRFTTSCSYTSGSTLRFNAYGNRPCGQPAIGNGVASTTTALNITGASTSGSGGITMNFGTSSLNCNAGTTLSLSTIPTSVPTQAGDTMVYTLPSGLHYNGNFVQGSNCSSCTITSASGGGGTTIVKVKLQPGVSSGTPLTYSFDVRSDGGGCGAVNVSGSYKRDIPPLSCGATPCSSSSVFIANGVSPDITLNKPGLNITGMTKLDESGPWVMGGWLNIVKIDYSNTGNAAYSAYTDTIEFYCNSSASTPFYRGPLRKNVAIGSSASDTFGINIWGSPCSVGHFVEARIPVVKSNGGYQCLCSPSALSASSPLPLGLLSFTAQNSACAVKLSWEYSEHTAASLKSLVVERSSGSAPFEPVAVLQPGVKSYVDVSPYSGQWLYRLRADHRDGAPEYSSSILTHTRSCQENSIEVYPNPAQQHLYIVLQGNSSDNRYELIDALGRRAHQGMLDQNRNNVLDVGHLPSGVYLLRIQSDKQ